MQFDLEVIASFDERRMGSIRNDPVQISYSQSTELALKTHISGSVTPRSRKAFCLAAKQAIRIDSVPPLVVTPAPSEGALNKART